MYIEMHYQRAYNGLLSNNIYESVLNMSKANNLLEYTPLNPRKVYKNEHDHFTLMR